MSETKKKTEKVVKTPVTTKPKPKAKTPVTKVKAKVTKPKAAAKVATSLPMVSNAGLMTSMREALTAL